MPAPRRQGCMDNGQSCTHAIGGVQRSARRLQMCGSDKVALSSDLKAATVSLAVARQNYYSTLHLVAELYPKFDLKVLKQALHNPDELGMTRVPISCVTENILIVTKYLNEPLLGLKVTNQIDYEASSVVQLLRSYFPRQADSRTNGETIIFLANYFAVITECIQVRLRWHRNLITMDVVACAEDLSRHQIEGAMLGIKQVLFYTAGCLPDEVLFEHSCAVMPSEYCAYFDVEPVFESHSNALIYQAKQRFSQIDEAAINTVKGFTDIMADEFPELAITERCRKIIRSILHFGEPTREHVANMMQISVSTLQRKLRAAGTSFKEELLSIRKGLANELLVDQNLTATQVAFLLGYQSEAQFFKAFKLWFGITPGQMKRGAKA